MKPCQLVAGVDPLGAGGVLVSAGKKSMEATKATKATVEGVMLNPWSRLMNITSTKQEILGKTQ